MKHLNDWIILNIKNFVKNSIHNTLNFNYIEKAWEEPLISFSSGDDEYYYKFKKEIGDFYWTPIDIYKKNFIYDNNVNPSDLSIISWILPQTKKTIQSQSIEMKFPSENWVRSRIFGEIFNNKLREFTVSFLIQKGYNSIAPTLDKGMENFKNRKT